MHPQLNQNMKFSKYILGNPGASLLVVPNKMPNDSCILFQKMTFFGI